MSAAAAAFHDDPGWATGGASPSDAAAGFAPPSAGGKVPASDDFPDDFDADFLDDDDAFFSSATGGGGAAGVGAVGSASGGVGKAELQPSASSFGMAALTYKDAAAAARSMRGSAPRPTSPAFGQDDADDDIGDDDELQELDRKHLAPLRNPGSSHRAVAASCLMLHQLVCSADPHNQTNGAVSSASAAPIPMQVESSSLYHVQRHQRRVHRILSSLTDCAKIHELPPCRSLACRTLASVARASFARLRFDARLETEPVRHPAITQLEDECGSGTAYSLVVAAIEQGDDGVSSAALEALGRLTLDPHTDNLAAEVRGMAENASNNVFMYEEGSKSFWILGHAAAVKELQSKAWERVVFPRMQTILQRLSLYSSPHLLARAIPVVTAAFVHALTEGSDTMPSRRALQTGKESHAKRGWREVDAEGLAAVFVEGVLLPCFMDKHPFHSDTSLQRAMAVAFLRLSSAAPHAPWRPSACRHAVKVLLQQLNAGMAATASASQAWSSSTKVEKTSATSPISTAVSAAAVPVETLAGTAAMLVIALRGIPLRERAPGLVAVLRAALLFLPLGMSVPSGAGPLDLPIGTVQEGGRASHYRLGRTGLLTEVALSIMLDGSSNSSAQQNDGKMTTGARSVLLQHVLQSKQLTQVWDESNKGGGVSPADDLVWVFCSVATQVEKEREKLFVGDAASAAEWSSLGLVLLDSFASVITVPNPESKSPFASESRAAYTQLFAAVLKRCGALPPSALSISEKALPNPLNGDSVVAASPVEGGPISHLDHVASALAMVSTKILFLKDKAKLSTGTTEGTSVETSSQFTHLAALLVDAWLRRCIAIANHDAKESNEDQLGAGLIFVPLCHSEVEALLRKHRSVAQENNAAVAARLCRILIACLEHVASMSDILAHASDGTAESAEKDVGPLAVSMLNEIVTSAKEGVPTDTDQGAKLRYQVALDASHAIARITERIRVRPQSLPEDIAAAFHASPLIEAVGPNPSPNSLNSPVEHCSWFLYNHARLVLSRRTSVAAEAVAPTACSSGALLSSRRIQPRNDLRLPSAFSHSSIELYEKGTNETLLLPTKSTRWKTAVVSGCSDPVSVNTSWDIRRVRKSDSSEKAMLVVTVKVFNITPVPIRNGIRLDLNVAQETTPNNSVGNHDYGSACTASQDFKDEIKGNGDFVTWEVVMGHWRPGPLCLSVFVTFRDMQQEPHSKTHKLMYPGMGTDVPVEEDDDYDDDSVELDDVTLAFMPVRISFTATLQPCSLVFFGGLSRCKSTLGCGDAASFELLWKSMEKKHTGTIPIPFTFLNDEDNAGKTLRDTKKGYVVVSSTEGGTSFGSAFMDPNGNRVLCVHRTRDGAHSLSVRSDSSDLLGSICGTTKLQIEFLQFIFGPAAKAKTGETTPKKQLAPGHDFPSLTMPHRLT